MPDGKFNLTAGASWKQIPCNNCERNTSASKWSCNCDIEWRRCRIHRAIGFNLEPPKRKAKEPRKLFEQKGNEEQEATDDEEHEEAEVVVIDEAPIINSEEGDPDAQTLARHHGQERMQEEPKGGTKSKRKQKTDNGKDSEVIPGDQKKRRNVGRT